MKDITSKLELMKDKFEKGLDRLQKVVPIYFRRGALPLLTFGIILGSSLSCGGGKKPTTPHQPRTNSPPVIEITNIDALNDQANITWAGYDSDGKIIKYQIGIDNQTDIELPPQKTDFTYTMLSFGEHEFRIEAFDDSLSSSGIKKERFGIEGPQVGKIAFQFLLKDSWDSSAFGIIDAAGTNFKQLTPFRTEGYYDCALSRDRTKVAFSSKEPGENFISLHTVNSDGSGITRVTNVDYDCRSPSWSPDGSQIVSSSWWYGLKIVNSDGSDLKTIPNTFSGDRSPCYSLEGKIAFLSTDEEYLNNICTINSDGSERTKLLEISAGGRLDWSPDGSKIYFDEYIGGDRDIYILDVDTKTKTRLTNGPYSNWSPTCSPDGEKILFQNTNWSHLIDKDGSNYRTYRPMQDNFYFIFPDWK
ncbi:hypothetical protein COU58_01065 [Candidatus Pacearchaeota archaeon CG10_big_fil_rev_8_21_14_0_10_32_42]|nr:MAG: hypothetical protein COU58_01065 [Candidatus Pacearchaeota archaeon CG10_big_fil_rev_8_21_14_0_10_32_42]